MHVVTGVYSISALSCFTLSTSTASSSPITFTLPSSNEYFLQLSIDSFVVRGHVRLVSPPLAPPKHAGNGRAGERLPLKMKIVVKKETDDGQVETEEELAVTKVVGQEGTCC